MVQFDFLSRLLARPASDPAPPGLVVVRSPRAKRYLLRVLPDGTARVTIPRRGSQREGLAFAERQSAWIERQRERLRARPVPRSTWLPGDVILLRGQAIRLEPDGRTIRLGPVTVTAPADGSDLRPGIERRLRAIASRELPERTYALANLNGFTVHRVTVRAQRTRWGSCSSRGSISLNWRLIHAPDSVRDYIILHELAHRRHMNHSHRFWAEVERLCPAWRDAETWLKQHPLTGPWRPVPAG